MKLPDDVRRGTVEVATGPLAVLHAGDSGPHVVLVPGYTGSKEDFRLVLQPLAALGYRVLAVDLRGQYESTGPDDPGAYTVAALASEVQQLIATLDEPVHLVGHSFGGLVCRAASLLDQNQLRSLTLLASGPAALSGARVDAVAAVRPLLESSGLVAVADLLDELEAKLPPEQQRPAELLAFLRTRLLANNPVGLMAMADALTSEPDRVDELAGSGLPVLVAYGESDDAWSPTVQAEMAERLGARHVVIDAAAHSPAVENPDATVAALSAFFAAVDGRR